MRKVQDHISSFLLFVLIKFVEEIVKQECGENSKTEFQIWAIRTVSAIFCVKQGLLVTLKTEVDSLIIFCD